jgi:hypothetical protein
LGGGAGSGDFTSRHPPAALRRVGFRIALQEPDQDIQAMRNTTRNLRNRIRLQKIKKKLVQQAKQHKKEQKKLQKK